MANLSARLFLAAALLSLALSHADAHTSRFHEFTNLSSTGKPLAKRPPLRRYKTVLSLDGGGIRGIMTAVVLIELEQSIKRYLLSKPYLLPYGAEISTVDDFDINLVDYFDCVTGISAGSWVALYIASRGGQGASRGVLDDPAIVAKYGAIPSGGAEGLRVFFNEYMGVVYPLDSIDLSRGVPLDFTNPNAPGVLSPVFPLTGLESALEAFLGDTTLADLDTSVLVPAFDLNTSRQVYFVQNAFRSTPVTSTSILEPRVRPPTVEAAGVDPRFVFSEGEDYYLVDAGTAAGAVPVYFPSKAVSPVGSDEAVFNLIDGVIPVESTTLPAVFFTAAESGYHDIRRIAVMSVGTGFHERNLSKLSNAGALGWVDNFELLRVPTIGGVEGLSTLIDYYFNTNPRVKPLQYLRIQTSAPETTEEGMALNAVTEIELIAFVESIGMRVAQQYRDSLDVFVRDFIFG